MPVAALLGMVLSTIAWAADPDFSDVKDILGGRRVLLRTDDLVVSGGFGGSAVPSVLTLQTADSKITQVGRRDFRVTSGQAMSAVGRMYGIPNDVVATVVVGSSPSTFGVRIVDPVKGTTSFTPIPGTAASVNAITMADVNGDGYLDLIVEYTVRTGHDVLLAASAADLKNPASGLRWGPPVPLSVADQAPNSSFLGLAAGDFDGNGHNEIALAVVTPDFHATLYIYTVAAPTLSLSLAATTRVSDFFGPPGQFASLAAGRFGTTNHDQLVFVAASLLENYKVLAIDFKGLQPIPSPHVFRPGFSPGGGGGLARIRSARIDWFSERDQAALLLVGDGQQQLSILTFDADLNISQSPSVGPGFECISDLAVGNFDRRQPNPSPPPATERNPNLQLALLGSNCASTLFMNIYNVDTSTFQLSEVGGGVTALPGTPSAAGMSLAVGDTQGRAFPLGPPTRVTVDGSIQPQVVLGLPPMHIDYICTAGNLGPKCSPSVLNLTTKPSKYYSQYQTRQSSSNQSSNTNTTSFTFSTKESIGEKFAFGPPKGNSVTVDLKAHAQQTHNESVAKKYNTYSSKQFDVSTQTGFSDLVWFTAKRFNLYIYQVLGHCVAAAGNPAGDGCAAGTRPLYVQFSGPDRVLQHRIDGNLVEWYQPVQEPGNVFSYPWTPDLLKSLYPGFHALTSDPATVWATDSSGSSVSVSWSQGSGSSVTSGSVSTQSFNFSASVEGKVKIATVATSTTTVGFEYNNSGSVSTLNESTSTLGSSTGIKVVKPSFDNPGQYAYSAQLYIFGQDSPAGTVQQIPLSTDVKSSGPLWTSFVADPTDIGSGAGVWWAQAYTRPDVALNHPLRWNWTPPTKTTSDVLTFNAANTADPADSEFYFMKGLYITPASAEGNGPQIVQATEGDVIRLQARVYNYSLVDMPAGTTVHVRFYAQEWDNTTHNFEGKAFEINEVTLDPIPGFNSVSSGGQHPNWSLATTTFDTSQHADTYLIFWVVVWMERNGLLVPEVAGHGLRSLPGPSTGPLDLAIEPFSNNVGFYNQPFFVAPRASANVATAATGNVELDDVTVSPRQIRLGERATVTATLATRNAAASSVVVVFHDGDPQHGGEAFDTELVPHIRAGDVYVTKVKFQPRTCGLHTVFVTAQADTGVPATGVVSLNVECEATGNQFTGKVDRIGSGKADATMRLSGAVTIDGVLDLSTATVTVSGLLRESSGNELVRGNGGASLLPITLRARAGSRPTGAIFETPSGAQPSVRIEVKQRDPASGRLELSLSVDRATIPLAPQACSKTTTAALRTSVSIADTKRAPVEVSPELSWRCGSGQLRAP